MPPGASTVPSGAIRVARICLPAGLPRDQARAGARDAVGVLARGGVRELDLGADHAGRRHLLREDVAVGAAAGAEVHHDVARAVERDRGLLAVGRDSNGAPIGVPVALYTAPSCWTGAPGSSHTTRKFVPSDPTATVGVSERLAGPDLSTNSVALIGWPFASNTCVLYAVVHDSRHAIMYVVADAATAGCSCEPQKNGVVEGLVTSGRGVVVGVNSAPRIGSTLPSVDGRLSRHATRYCPSPNVAAASAWPGCEVAIGMSSDSQPDQVVDARSDDGERRVVVHRPVPRGTGPVQTPSPVPKLNGGVANCVPPGSRTVPSFAIRAATDESCRCRRVGPRFSVARTPS